MLTALPDLEGLENKRKVGETMAEIIFEDEEANGKNLIAQFKDPGVGSLTLMSKKSPSIGFLETAYKQYGFALDYSRETLDGVIETRLVRE
jgi:hypothetical protein